MLLSSCQSVMHVIVSLTTSLVILMVNGISEVSGLPLHTVHLIFLHIPLLWIWVFLFLSWIATYALVHWFASLDSALSPLLGTNNFHASLLSLTLSLSYFFAFSHPFSDYLSTLLSLALSCNAPVLTQNQDQDTKIPNSLISYLFLFSRGQLCKTCKKARKEKTTQRVQMQINTYTIKLLSKQTKSVLNNLMSCQMQFMMQLK